MIAAIFDAAQDRLLEAVGLTKDKGNDFEIVDDSKILQKPSLCDGIPHLKSEMWGNRQLAPFEYLRRQEQSLRG